MAKYYKLIDAVSTSQTFNLPHMVNGNRVYKYYTLYPNTKYVEHIDDPIFMDTLKDAHKRLQYSPQLEKTLKESGIRHEVITCKVCGGRAKKIDVWLVEVVE